MKDNLGPKNTQGDNSKKIIFEQKGEISKKIQTYSSIKVIKQISIIKLIILKRSCDCLLYTKKEILCGLFTVNT